MNTRTMDEQETNPGANGRFARAIALIDAANAEDPRRDREGDAEVPRELLYSQDRKSTRLNSSH